MMSSKMCLGSNVNSEQLRFQLDLLHKEASETAAKANNARLRLLRLSEAAEKLRQQAAKSIQLGKENDARDLLLQKKKVLQAMDKSKTRAHLLDELAAKLTQAISVKETRLIGKVASDLELDIKDVDGVVHVVSPVQDIAETMDDYDKSGQRNVDVGDDRDVQLDCEIEGGTGVDEKSRNIAKSEDSRQWVESELTSTLEGIPSYNHFLEHLDLQLSKIETDITAYLRFSNMVLENKEKATNVKHQQASEILDKIVDTRRRVREPGRHKEKSELVEAPKFNYVPFAHYLGLLLIVEVRFIIRNCTRNQILDTNA